MISWGSVGQVGRETKALAKISKIRKYFFLDTFVTFLILSTFTILPTVKLMQETRSWDRISQFLYRCIVPCAAVGKTWWRVFFGL